MTAPDALRGDLNALQRMDGRILALAEAKAPDQAAQLADLVVRRHQIRERVPEPYRGWYETLLVRGEAMPLVTRLDEDGRRCRACQMMLPASLRAQLRAAPIPVRCPRCARLLFDGAD